MLNFMKICPEGPRVVKTDGHKDMTKTTVAFRNSGKARAKKT